MGNNYRSYFIYYCLCNVIESLDWLCDYASLWIVCPVGFGFSHQRYRLGHKKNRNITTHSLMMHKHYYAARLQNKQANNAMHRSASHPVIFVDVDQTLQLQIIKIFFRHNH